MTGKDDAPLLVLNRADEGRVALFLSDHPWLWARGYEGGGPHVQLLRRTAHWLMKEPELDEERLTAVSDGRKVLIQRQTLGDAPGDAVVRSPSGAEVAIKLAAGDPGLFSGEADVGEFGLYSVANGDLTALVHVGPPNPREYSEVTSTTELLAPVLEEARGSVRRASASDMPRLVPVRQGARSFRPELDRAGEHASQRVEGHQPDPAVLRPSGPGAAHAGAGWNVGARRALTRNRYCKSKRPA